MTADRYWEIPGRILRGVWRMNLHKPVKFAVLFVLTLVLAWTVAAQTDWPGPDTAAIGKFEEEGLQHSHVMDAISYLSDVYRPRLPHSPNIPPPRDFTPQTLNSSQRA